MSKIPSTRQEARDGGAKEYFTGKPCSNGHLDKRSTKSACCNECNRNRARSKDFQRKRQCQGCGKTIELPVRKWCSQRCRSRSNNRKYQVYSAQKSRGLARKLELIETRGGGCEVCGYRRNVAALVFHHRDASAKCFEVDARALANRSVEACMAEVEKCTLLCQNCHAEEHHPDLDLTSSPAVAST